MTAGHDPRRVGIVGAGVAGAACARTLAEAGCAVQVFDKSRGVGGRMATRRASWMPEAGAAQAALFDHGVPWWTAQSPEFAAFLAQAEAAGRVQRWAPRLSGAAGAPVPAGQGWLGLPDMPALCRWMLRDIPLRAECQVSSLVAAEGRWSVLRGGEPVAQDLDAVVVAIPPAQAAVLWAPHRPQWAARALAHPMSPCWTLMALTDEPPGDPARAEGWDELLPPSPPLARVIRQDAKPGRLRTPGLAQWVAHADPGWSQQHLESDAQDVQAQLARALEQALGTALKWRYAVVHRWRYAQVVEQQAGQDPGPVGADARCEWDGQAGLGACGDHLGGGGIEAAWLSGRELAHRMLGSG
jgi:predicted NAD/FAD-dependent oxidoreductase